ncbi:RING finger protein [Endozoicomonas euniceicola]|uniref:RING-type domain-containing protein n=1 Tax=Endozoicomonas euniceicola TaxID=1234143 RepID=A0ABY6GR37_9GAMM|nr:hypothetical protein [Endozoicomonas euniceicola]UYM14464.1 hypothetical protein NX720_16385 [Endozoicomonas euniceicola]
MKNSKLFVRTIFPFFFIYFFLATLFDSSRLLAASDSVVCETFGNLTSGSFGKAFLTDSRQVYFKTVDDNRAVFTPSSASSLFYFLSTVLSAVGSAGVVFSGRSGDVWSHKNQWLTESPSQASVLEALLKNRLIPDASFSREVNDRKRNRLEGELERAIANWQQLVKKPSYPAVAISVSDASMRVVITRSDILRGTSLASLYEELINIQTQSYLALLDTEALNDIAGIVTGGLVASGSGGDGDDNDSTHYSFDAEPDAEPLVMVYDDSEYPAQDSAEELITKNQENKLRLLKVLRKKIQQAIALGHGDLARILDNRIMLIEADLEHLNDLETSSAGITENHQGSPGLLSFLKASLASDEQELQQRDDALKQALSQYPLGTDYQSVLIVSSELTHEEVLFYDRWQNTATGLVYQALKRRLVQQLQSETDDINVPTQQTESLISGLKALVHQFREMFSADLSSRYDGRQVPHQGRHEREQESNAARAAAGGQEFRESRNNHTNIAFQSYEGLNQEGDEGDEPPRKKVHTKGNNCSLCNHGVCSQKVSGVDGSGLTAAEENEKLLINPTVVGEKEFVIGGRTFNLTLKKPYPTELAPICLICLEYPKEPYSICEEKHLFCRSCYRAGMKDCPSCRVEGDLKDRSEEPTTFPIQGFPYICPVGCGLYVEKRDLEKHVTSCTPLDCGACDYKGNRLTIDEHKRKFCPESVVACSSCCSEIKRGELDDHEKECPEVDVKSTLPQIGSVNLKRRQIVALEDALQTPHAKMVKREAFGTLLQLYNDKPVVDKPSKTSFAPPTVTTNPTEIFTLKFDSRYYARNNEVLQKTKIRTHQGKIYELSVINRNTENCHDRGSRYRGFQLQVTPCETDTSQPVMANNNNVVAIEVHAVKPFAEQGLKRRFAFPIDNLLKGSCESQQKELARLFNEEELYDISIKKKAFFIKIIL